MISYKKFLSTDYFVSNSLTAAYSHEVLTTSQLCHHFIDKTDYMFMPVDMEIKCQNIGENTYNWSNRSSVHLLYMDKVKSLASIMQ